MSNFWTWGDIRDKVERDLDLEGETFITPTEMLGLANEAIDEVERQIHTLYEDYFLTRAWITLVAGQEAYDLPDDIYAMKIRGVMYRNGTSVFKLSRIRDWQKFELYEVDQTNQGSNANGLYAYLIAHETAGSPKIIFTPTPQESGQYVRLWYLRNANELVDDDSVCDIPEAVNYIIQYIKVRCYEKEGHPMLQKAIADLAQERETTLAVLATMVPDAENEIEPDVRLYNDMT